MRFLTVLLITTLFSGLAFARGGEGGMERTRLGLFYGYGSLAPTDVNNYINAVGGSPKDNSLTSFFYYGGEIGYMVTPRLELTGEYNQQSANNPVNNSFGLNSGVQLSLNAFFAGLNYYLVDHGPIRFRVGGQVGYPTYAHATIIQGSYSQYDSTFAPIYQGLADVDFMLGHRFSIFAEGGYQYALLNALSNGANLKNPSTGNNVNFDMSGWRWQAGLNFYF